MTRALRPGVARLAAALVLVVLPLALRLAAVDHGRPHSYVPDSHVVRNALGMAKDKDLVPPNLKYSSYPNLLPYCLLPIYAGQYALGRVTGAWAGAGEFAQVVSADPFRVHLPARVLVALFGALTPLVVFLGARAAGLRAGAWVAAWLVATGLLHAHFSVQERPWVPMVFFFALAAWPAARYAREPRVRYLVLSGAAAGLAFATHQAGAGALGIPGFAWLAAGAPWSRWRERLAHGFAAVGLFALVALVLGHPYWIRYGWTPSAEFAGAEAFTQESEASVAIAGQALVFDLRLASLTRLSKVLFGYDPVLVLLALAGVALAVRRRETRAAALLGLLWAAFFLTNQNDKVRYLLPVAVLAATWAGLAAERFLVRPSRLPWLAVLLAVPLVQVLRLDWVLSRPDTRETAARLLRELPEGSLVAIDRYGPEVELSARSLERLAGWRDLRTREAMRAARLEAGVEEDPGIDAVRVEEFLRFDERAGTVEVAAGREALGADPGEALARLGVTHVLLVDRDPGEAPHGLLARWVEGPPAWTVRPTRPGSDARARLPMEMEFPLTALWATRRPGPWLGLYAR